MPDYEFKTTFWMDFSIADRYGIPVIKDTYYHKICGKNNVYYVYLKNPQVEEYEIKE